jgi:hypothetical protein
VTKQVKTPEAPPLEHTLYRFAVELIPDETGMNIPEYALQGAIADIRAWAIEQLPKKGLETATPNDLEVLDIDEAVKLASRIGLMLGRNSTIDQATKNIEGAE